MSILHPQKSIDYLVFVGDPAFDVVFTKPAKDGKSSVSYKASYRSDYGFTVNTDVAISTSDVAGTDNGRWQWTAHYQGKAIASAFWDINPITGAMEAELPGSPWNMMMATSSTGKGWAVSYGFYDSGSGWAGDLTNHDQSYVYVTPSTETVLADVTSMNDGAMKARPLSAFVLAGAHDAGTWDVSAMQKICGDATLSKSFRQMMQDYAQQGLLASLGTGFVGLLATIDPGDTLKLVQDLAVTQKDNVTTMLGLGVRYFDFRPGYCAPAIRTDDEIYHQHTCIPGARLQDFLTDIFAWLSAQSDGHELHGNEIVVVSLNFQGFADAAYMSPTVEALQTIIDRARTDGCAGARVIETGGLDDLATSYADLIAANRRVIFLNQIAAPVDDVRDTNSTAKYDSYNDAYKTLDPEDVIKQLCRMTPVGQSGFDYTVLQLQGTAQGVYSADADTVTDCSWSGSPLMATKAAFDSVTYPWLLENLRPQVGDKQLVVLLNDFADNALAFHTRLIMTAKATAAAT